MIKKYGTITYDKTERAWMIRCEAHVAIRMKRIFSKIYPWQFDTLSLSATPENCRDLEWFLQRYPMDVYPSELLRERSQMHSEKQTVVEELLSGMAQPLKFQLLLPPREYQALAASVWIASGGLLLADDVGLGKTASSIAGLTDPRTRPALVVTLTHLPKQWSLEVAKFSNMTTHILKKATPYNIAKWHDGKMPDIIISNYHKLAGWSETLHGLIKAVIFDECQELRHSTSQKYGAAKHIAAGAAFRLGMSATPIYNYGGEIFNVVDVLQPDALGTKEEFTREWCVYDDQKPKIKDPSAFGLYVRESGIMLRRTRKDVGRELPGVTPIPHHIDANPDVILQMKGKAVELAKLILKQTQDFKGQKMQAAAEFDMKMRQATGIAKAPFVAEFVRFLVESNNEPVVLFGWHREVYKVWQEALKDLNPVLYTGTESPAQKDANKERFLRGESKVMIISLRAGAGMDGLQDICRIAVFGELDWSPGVHEQCIGRIYRDGQAEKVVAYYLLSEQGSDPIMSDVLGVKKQQVEGIRDPNSDLVTKLQIEEDYIKKMAEKFLTDAGIPLPTIVPATQEASI